MTKWKKTMNVCADSVDYDGVQDDVSNGNVVVGDY
jgi:hypothetical protein